MEDDHHSDIGARKSTNSVVSKSQIFLCTFVVSSITKTVKESRDIISRAISYECQKSKLSARATKTIYWQELQSGLVAVDLDLRIILSKKGQNGRPEGFTLLGQFPLLLTKVSLFSPLLTT